MSILATAHIQKIASLAKLQLDAEKLAAQTQALENVLKLVKKMDDVKTDDIAPLAHPLNVTQPLRADVVTEHNQRDLFQKNAPQVEAGLYIVPKFLETE